MGYTSDIRKCTQLHQKHKRSVRKKANQYFVLSHLRLGKSGKSRPTRSSIRRQLVDFDDNNSEENTNDEYEEYLEKDLEWAEIQAYIDAQWKEIIDAVNHDDADLLESIVPPINIYNPKKTYWSDELYLQHTRNSAILFHAIDLGHTKCIRILLDKVYSGDLDPDIVNEFDWETPLSSACRRGDLDLVRELIECAHANINDNALLSIAIQAGHYKMVEYLLSQGYSIQSSGNENILHNASCLGHLEIVKSLLKYGADPKARDQNRYTALDYAMIQRHIDIVEILLDHTHGDIAANGDHFTPMMLAAYYDLKPIVNLLFTMLPRDRAADDLLRLACRYAIDLSMQDLDMALYFFVHGLNNKQTSDHVILNEVYESRRECQTVDQLESIANDENALRIHALLVNERIFLQRRDVCSYIDLVDKQCEYYHNHRLFHRSLQLRLHAYQLILRVQNDCEESRRLHENSFSLFVNDLRSILSQDGLIPINPLVIISNWIFYHQMQIDGWNCPGFDLLPIIICMIQSKQVKNDERYVLFNLVQQIVQSEYTQTYLGHFIQQIARGVALSQYGQLSISTLNIVRLLIQCGADVNQTYDRFGRRPLHIIAHCSDITIAKPVIELLLTSGAHLDTIDYQGYLPQDRAWTPDVKKLLCKSQKLSLKCRCAQMIVSSKIHYESHLNSNLITFVKLHSYSLPSEKSLPRSSTDW